MNEEKPHVIVGTAGHIDHGKSSLVKALTGIDPDTLPEEKERVLIGICIFQVVINSRSDR